MPKMYPYPWLTPDKTFEYRDIHDQPLIDDNFDDAEPFYGEYAVVGKKEKYGVIDSSGNTILSLKYDALKHYYNGIIHIFAVKEEYNAPWRFWNWKLLPEYNILSPSNRGPFLVTRVPRARWRLVVIPGKKPLARLYKDDSRSPMGTDRHWSPYWEPNRTLPRQLNFSFYDSEIQYRNKLFHWTGKRLRRKFNHIYAKLDENIYLKSKKNKFYRVDSTGRKLDQEVFTRDNQVIFKTTSGRSLVVPAQREHQHKIVRAPILRNRSGRYFLFPNLNQPLPSFLAPHPEIGEIKQILLLAPHPTSEWFIVLATDPDSYKRYCFLVNQHGEWMRALPPLEGLHWVAERGELILDYSKKPQIVDAQFQLHNVPVKNISMIPSSTELYAGKCIETGKYGVYNLQSQSWQIPPEYSYISNEIIEGIVIYSKILEPCGERTTRRELNGLLDIHQNKELTPPLYDWIKADGRVQLEVNGVKIRFYIDPLTGEELRIKEELD